MTTARLVDTGQRAGHLDTVDVTAAPESDWQRLWFSLQTTPWTALAVVPVDSGIDVASVADRLVAIGRDNGARHVKLLSSVGVRSNDVPAVLERIEDVRASGGTVVVVCDSVDGSPATVPIARAASRVLLIVRLGKSRIDAARKTLDAVGRDKVFAGITVSSTS